MKVFKSLDEIGDQLKGCVLALGNFDGVHRGHQALITKTAEIAKANNQKLAVLTFEPHPRQLFHPDQHPARLTPFAMKAERLKAHQVDAMVTLNFDWDFASQTAEDFIQTVLKEGIGAAHIVIGYDFRFGQLRKGSAETIAQADLPVDSVEAVTDEKGETISSSRIRQLIKEGRMAEANALLGWDWEIQGTVFRGDRRGHALGYPTANVMLKDTIHPAYGVYACLVQIEGEKQWHKAATNIGIRPMFEVPEGQVEAHILDFPDRDIYDQTLRIKPVQRLRGEAKFNALDDLIAQMDKDCAQAREILSDA